MEPLKERKSTAVKTDALIPIWCEHCHVRIAPYERSVVDKDKAYHRHCVSKINEVN